MRTGADEPIEGLGGVSPALRPTVAVTPGVVELVLLVAGLMALTALAIDIMLPGLSPMGEELKVTEANRRQYVIVAFLIGVGFGQLFFGPLSDRFGRRTVLLYALAGYVLFGAACALAWSFDLLIAARALGGISAAGARVVSVSVVRDLYAGRGMARVMSLVVVVFMAIPILAPSIGQVILMVATWRWVFGVLVVFGLVMAIWVVIRLPETLAVESRRSLGFRELCTGYWQVVRTRSSAGYTVATGLIFGALFAFISSSEQVFVGLFGKEGTFPLYFAGVASAMSGAALINSRLVEQLGARRVSHAAVLVFVFVNLAYIYVLSLGQTGFGPFYATMTLSFFLLGFIGANFNALAMEPLGHIAGTGSAVLGFASTTLAGAIGGAIGQQFDGTTRPLAVGFVLGGFGAVAALLYAEGGHLFSEPGNPPTDPPPSREWAELEKRDP